MFDCTVNRQQMKKRTREYYARIAEFCGDYPVRGDVDYLRNELLRAGSSIAANYRAACHAPSRSDFISRLSVVLEEADKSLYLLDLLVDNEPTCSALAKPLIKEGNRLVAILVYSISSGKPETKRFQSFRGVLTA